MGHASRPSSRHGRARGCAASWTADLAVVEARQPSSVVFQRPEAKLGQRASAGSGRSTVTLATARTAPRRPWPARCVMLPHRSVLAHIRGHLLLQVDRALERVSWRVSWRASWWPAEAAIILSPPLLTTPPRQGSGPAAARWRFR